MPVTKTVKPGGGGDYTTLQAAYDFVVAQTLPTNYNIVVYGGGDAGTLALANASFPISASTLIDIYAADGEGWVSSYDTNKAKIVVPDSVPGINGLNKACSFLRVRGIQFVFSNTYAAETQGIACLTGSVTIAESIVVDGCLFVAPGSTALTNTVGVALYNPYSVSVTRCVAQGLAFGIKLIAFIASSTKNVIDQSTVNLCGNGFYFDSSGGGVASVTNCTAIASTVADFAKAAPWSTLSLYGCSSSDTTATAFSGSGNHINVSTSGNFASSTNWALQSGSALRGAGTASTTEALDRVGNSFPTPTDVGAYAYHAFVSSTTTIGSPLNPSTPSASVFTATVTGASGTATGTVSFLNGASTLGTSVLSAGVTTFGTASLADGTYSITAVYSGDPTYNASTSSPLSQVVADMASLASSNTTVTTSVTPVAPAATLVITATVTGTTPAGVVTFYNDGGSIGTGTLSTAGITTLTLNPVSSKLGLGTHSITAVYPGDAGNGSSVSVPVIQSVNFGSVEGSSAQLTPNLRVDVLPSGGLKFVANGSEVAP